MAFELTKPWKSPYITRLDGFLNRNPPTISARQAFYDTLREREIEQVRGDLDLFGDQSLRLLATPGHTPGHMSLLLRLPTAGSIILAADAAHFRFNLEHCLVPKINSNIA